MATESVYLRIEGIPQSWQAPYVTRKGRVFSKAKMKQWQRSVILQARAQRQGPLLSGPLMAQYEFVLPSPKNAFAGQLKNTKPDLANLVKCLEDALEGTVIENDACIALYLFAFKRYALNAEQPHATVRLWPAADCNEIALSVLRLIDQRIVGVDRP